MLRGSALVAAADDAADDFVHVGFGGDEIGVGATAPRATA
jgi:hypothetical protein